MSIKPVLVPDHDAADLRALMDSFATAAQLVTPAAQANRIRQQLTEMDYGGGRSPHAGMGLPRDDDDDIVGKKEIMVKPETVKKTVKSVGDKLDQAFSQAYNDKGVSEGSEPVDDTRGFVRGEVSGRNQLGKGAEFAVKAFYGDRIQPHPQRNDPRIAKRQAGVDRAVDRLTAEDVAEGIDPIEQLRADIRRFAR